MKRAKLVDARARKNWTLEGAAEQIGCSPNTLSRWELGIMTPSAYNRARLCQAYGVTAETLGLAEDEISFSLARSEDAQTLIHADFTTHLQDIALSPLRSCTEMQLAIAHAIEEFTMTNTGHDAVFTRREALRRLAMFPVVLSGSSMQRPVEHILSLCAAGITSCGYLSDGTAEEMSLASSMLSAYLPILKTIVGESSAHRKEAANLVAQSYLLKQILGLHVENPNTARGYGEQAVLYSDESSDPLLKIATRRRLTWAYVQEMQPLRALKMIEQAKDIIKQCRTPLPSRACSSIYSTLAVIQTKNGISPTSSLSLAQETFFAASSKERDLGNTNFSYAQLVRNEGLVYYHQGEYQKALDTYAKAINPNDLTPKVPMPERTRVELLHKQTMAALKNPSRDMEQAILYWEASMQGSILLRSQQHFDEACMAYEVMEGIWHNEKQVKLLRELTVHW